MQLVYSVTTRCMVHDIIHQSNHYQLYGSYILQGPGFSPHWLGVVGSNHHSAITVSPTSAVHGVPNMPAQDAQCTGNVWGVVGWLRRGVLYGMVRIVVSSTLQKEKESAEHKIAL